MAYSNGVAVDFTAVRTALISACTAEGWTWDSGNEVLHKRAATSTCRLSVAICAYRGVQG